jgi:hypothetical protein
VEWEPRSDRTPEAFEDYQNRFVAALVLATAMPDLVRREMSEKAIGDYELSVILPQWLEILG